MAGIVFIALMGVTINCNELINKPGVDPIWQKPVCDQLSKDYVDVELIPLKSHVLQIKDDSKREIQTPLISSLKGGRLKVTVYEKNKDSTHSEVTYLFSVNAYKDVWVMSRSMNSGSIIKEQDVFKSKMNVAPLMGVKTLVEDNPVGKKLKFSQKKSSFLFDDSLDVPNLVSTGDKLAAKIVNGNVNIEAYVIALEAGSEKGQQIKVRLIATGATFQATIKGNKNVQIDI